VQAVRIVVYARNHALDGNVWRQVAITVGDVREVLLRTPGNFINRICCGVKLLRFGDWCVDIDGTYAQRHRDPTKCAAMAIATSSAARSRRSNSINRQRRRSAPPGARDTR
jgi:hypothetical protein